METERRHQPRKQPEKLTYVHFEPENGGIVLNASEGGISFFAIVPLHQTGTIRFAIVPGTQERIIAAGQIVWTDELKKVGGLSFAELAPGKGLNLGRNTCVAPRREASFLFSL